MRAGETLTDPADLVQEARCVYVEQGKTCRKPAIGVLMAHGPQPMCDRHLQKQMHPPDLHGRLARW